MKKLLTKAFMLAAMFSIAQSATAAVIYLDFENIAPYPNDSTVQIAGYYNGGTSSFGTSGTNFGVEFSSGATLLCLNNVGETCSNTSRGDVGISTSRNGALYFPTTNPFMNVAAGFTNGFSFVYSDPFAAGSFLSIFDGLNGTGNLLTTVVLPGTLNGRSGGCDAAYDASYCPFNSFGVSFSGVAQSVLFGGSVNSQVFDDITFGSSTVGGTTVPEPSTLAILMLSVLGLTLKRKNS